MIQFGRMICSSILLWMVLVCFSLLLFRLSFIQWMFIQWAHLLAWLYQTYPENLNVLHGPSTFVQTLRLLISLGIGICRLYPSLPSCKQSSIGSDGIRDLFSAYSAIFVRVKWFQSPISSTIRENALLVRSSVKSKSSPNEQLKKREIYFSKHFYQMEREY